MSWAKASAARQSLAAVRFAFFCINPELFIHGVIRVDGPLSQFVACRATGRSDGASSRLLEDKDCVASLRLLTLVKLIEKNSRPPR